jgi:hypothetical protein
LIRTAVAASGAVERADSARGRAVECRSPTGFGGAFRETASAFRSNGLKAEKSVTLALAAATDLIEGKAMNTWLTGRRSSLSTA